MMKANLTKVIKIFCCCSISILCLIYLGQKVDAHSVIKLLGEVSYTWLLLATIVGISKMWWTGLRWCYLGSNCGKMKTTSSFYFYTIGTMANMLLPFRAGDLLRTRLISNEMKTSKVKVLASITSEHILDFSVLILFTIACMAIYSCHLPNQFDMAIVTTVVVMLSFIAGLILMRLFSLISFPGRLNNILNQTKFTSVKKMISNFYCGFLQFGSYTNVMKVVILTAIIWLAQCIWIYAIFHSIGMTVEYKLGVKAVLITVVMMGFASMIPATPGYIGTFHLMVVLGLEQLGVSKSVALTCAILAHAHSVVWALLVGLYSLWQINMKLPLDSQRVLAINEADL